MAGVLERISDEDRGVAGAVRREIPAIARAVEAVVAAQVCGVWCWSDRAMRCGGGRGGVVQGVGKEGVVIRLTLMPFLYYALLPGAIGYSVVWFAERGVLNLGTALAALIAVAAVATVVTLGRKSSSESNGRQS